MQKPEQYRLVHEGVWCKAYMADEMDEYIQSLKADAERLAEELNRYLNGQGCLREARIALSEHERIKHE